MCVCVCVCVCSVFVLPCEEAEALRRIDPPSMDSYPLCIGSINWKEAKVQQMDI
jgi:hypothetical protein